MLNIHLENGSFDHTAVQLSNLSGSLVSETMVESGTSYQLNTSDLPKGIYYLNLRDKTGVVSKKIVIQ